jgi:hypothetical protein
MQLGSAVAVPSFLPSFLPRSVDCSFKLITMLEKCTYLSAACPVGMPDAQLQAYRKIIDLADVVLGVYDLGSPALGDAEDRALAYAVDTAHKPVLVLDPLKLTTVQINEHFPPTQP